MSEADEAPRAEDKHFANFRIGEGVATTTGEELPKSVALFLIALKVPEDRLRAVLVAVAAIAMGRQKEAFLLTLMRTEEGTRLCVLHPNGWDQSSYLLCKPEPND